MNAPDPVALEALAGRIRQAHEFAVRSAKDTLTYARQAGGLLLSAKKQVPHGQWLAWLSENVPFSARAAQAYMRVVERWSELEAKYAEPAHLTMEKALEHLAASGKSAMPVECEIKESVDETATTEASIETANVATPSSPPVRRERRTRLTAEQRAVAREVRASMERRAEAPGTVCPHCGQRIVW